jgi:nucleoside-diphosphate-sugar epimerase
MVPPGLRHNPSKNHVSEMSLVIPYISRSQIKQVIYLSSISVFKDSTDFNLITNTSIPDAETNTAKQLGTIESLLLNNTAFKATVIRFGGLIGNQRHPGKYLAGKTALKNPEAPINLIHKTDCIHIIHRVLMAEPGNLAINAVYPWHPSKERYYTDYCLRKGLAVPKYDHSTTSIGKIIDSSIVEQLLSYKFQVKP